MSSTLVRGQITDQRHAGLRLILLALSQFVVAADFDIVFVALPEIGRHLGFDAHSIQWVVSAYTVTLGGLLLVGGRAADRFGGRRVLTAGLATFCVASLGAGAAGSPEALVAARAVQGLGAALLFPASLKLINTIFAEGTERGRALAIWGLAGSTGAAVGAIGGGVLTGSFGWQWVFFVNVPVTLAGALAVPRLLPEDRPIRGETGTFDIPGALLATAAAILVLFGVVQRSERGWGAVQSAGPLALALILAISFLVLERRLTDPLVPLSLLRRRGVAIAMALVFLLMSTVGTVYLLFTTYLQNVLGYPPLRAGLAFLPLSLLSAVGSGWLFPRLMTRQGIARTLFIGTAGFGISILLIALGMTDGGSYPALLPGIATWGLFAGTAYPAVFAAAGIGIPAERQGVVAGLVSTAQFVGGAIGLAILVGVANAGIDQASGPSEVIDGLRSAGFCAAAVMVVGSFLALGLRQPLVTVTHDRSNTDRDGHPVGTSDS